MNEPFYYFVKVIQGLDRDVNQPGFIRIFHIAAFSSGDPKQWQKKVTAVTIHISKHECALPEQCLRQLASPSPTPSILFSKQQNCSHIIKARFGI